MPKGYVGKMLWADLSQRNISVEDLDNTFCRRFLGGYGFGARLLFSRQRGKVDPLGEENILGFATGPFSGTPVLGGSPSAQGHVPGETGDRPTPLAAGSTAGTPAPPPQDPRTAS